MHPMQVEQNVRTFDFIDLRGLRQPIHIFNNQCCRASSLPLTRIMTQGQDFETDQIVVVLKTWTNSAFNKEQFWGDQKVPYYQVWLLPLKTRMFNILEIWKTSEWLHDMNQLENLIASWFFKKLFNNF